MYKTTINLKERVYEKKKFNFDDSMFYVDCVCF